jgi:hypothetical protein
MKSYLEVDEIISQVEKELGDSTCFPTQTHFPSLSPGIWSSSDSILIPGVLYGKPIFPVIYKV